MAQLAHWDELAELKWEEQKRKTYTAWLNSVLQRHPSAESKKLLVSDIRHDLADGVRLCYLFELLHDEEIHFKGASELKASGARFFDDPSSDFHKQLNVQLALDFFQEKSGVQHGVSAPSLVQEDRKPTLGLVWQLVCFYSPAIQDATQALPRPPPKGAKSSMQDVKASLLDWCRQFLPDGLAVKDFTSSWQDGRAFFHVVRGALDQAGRTSPDESVAADAAKLLETCRPLPLLKHAFQQASRGFGADIATLSPKLVAQYPDDTSIIVYLATLQARCRASQLSGALGGAAAADSEHLRAHADKLVSENDALRRERDELAHASALTQSEVAELRAGQDERIAELRRQLESAQAKQAALRLSHEKLTDARQDLAGELMGEKESADEMRRRNAELASRVQALSELEAETAGHRERLEETLQAANLQLLQALAERDSLKALGEGGASADSGDLIRLEQQLAQAQRERDELHREQKGTQETAAQHLASQKQLHDQLQEQLTRQRGETQSARDELADASRKLQHAQDDLDDEQRRARAAEQRADAAEDARVALATQRETDAGELVRLRLKCDQLERRHTALQDASASSQALAEQKLAAVSALEAARASLSQELERARVQVEVAEKEIANVRAERESARSRLQDEQKRLSDVQLEFDQGRIAKQDALAKVSELEGRLKSRESALEDADRRLRASQGKFKAADDELAALRKELLAARQQADEARIHQQAHEEARGVLENELAELQQALTQARADAKRREAEAASANSQLAQLQEQVDGKSSAAGSAASMLQTRNDELSQEVEALHSQLADAQRLRDEARRKQLDEATQRADAQVKLQTARRLAEEATALGASQAQEIQELESEVTLLLQARQEDEADRDALEAHVRELLAAQGDWESRVASLESDKRHASAEQQALLEQNADLQAASERDAAYEKLAAENQRHMEELQRMLEKKELERRRLEADTEAKLRAEAEARLALETRAQMLLGNVERLTGERERQSGMAREERDKQSVRIRELEAKLREARAGSSAASRKLRDDNQQLKTENDRLKRRVAQLEAEVGRLRAELDAMRQTRDEAKAASRDLQQRLRDCEAELEQAPRQADLWQKHHEHAKDDLRQHKRSRTAMSLITKDVKKQELMASVEEFVASGDLEASGGLSLERLSGPVNEKSQGIAYELKTPTDQMKVTVFRRRGHLSVRVGGGFMTLKEFVLQKAGNDRQKVLRSHKTRVEDARTRLSRAQSMRKDTAMAAAAASGKRLVMEDDADDDDASDAAGEAGERRAGSDDESFDMEDDDSRSWTPVP